MAVPFGFSVSDFIAAIQLVAKAIEALQDSGGAASQYQSLARDLSNLQVALLKVDSLQAGNNSPTAGTIYDQTSLARQNAQELLEEVSKFERKLGKQAKKGWENGFGRKIQWAVLQSKETTKAKETISQQVQNLSMLSMLQILEAVQNLDKSQQDLCQISLDTTKSSKAEVQESINQLSSAQDARINSVINELKSSLAICQSSMEPGFKSNVTQSKLLGDAIRNVLDRTMSSLSQFQGIMVQDGQERKAELGRFNERMTELRSTLSESSASSSRRLELATEDVKDTIFSVSETAIQSHAEVARNIAQDLEVKIATRFASALAEFGKKPRPGTEESFHETGDIYSEAVTIGSLVRKSGGAYTMNAFFEGWLAKILETLYTAMRRIQLSVIWLLPLVTRFIIYISRNIPRQLPRLLENSIRFEDALGRVSLLPYEYFRHWEVFQSMLQCNFKGLPGESNVNSRFYFLLHARRLDQVITQQTWNKSVFPSANINMSILLSCIDPPDSTCPRCKSTNAAKDTNVRCQECQLEYYSGSKTVLKKRQDGGVRALFKRLRLYATHEDSGLNIIPVGLWLIKNSGILKFNNSWMESENFTTQLGAMNEAQDTGAFQRIYTLILRKVTYPEKGRPRETLDKRLWNRSTPAEWADIMTMIVNLKLTSLMVMIERKK